MNVLVLGAGVVGLWCARELLAAGHRVRLWSKDDPLETTSSIAAAIWYPYEVQPADRVVPWALHSLRVYTSLAKDPASGIRLVGGVERTHADAEPPAWLRALPGFEELATSELGPGYARGWHLRVPVIETPRHLPWLVHGIHAAGGAIETRAVERLEEAEGEADVIVNATGLGARALCGDEDLHPIQGQVVCVEAGGLDRWTFFQRTADTPGYVIPRTDDVVLGGSAIHDAWSRTPDDERTEHILASCAEEVPELAGRAPRRIRVGLRPGRTTVRLEREERTGGTPIVHVYGHGGAGVTLAAGCADEVRRIVEER